MKRIDLINQKLDVILSRFPYIDDVSTVQEIYEDYLKTVCKSLQCSSLASKEYIFRRYILSSFGSRVMSSISKLELIQWFSTMNLSASYITTIKAHFNAFYTYAEKYYNIPNILRQINLKLKHNKISYVIYSVEDYNLFRHYLKNSKYGILFDLIFYGGLRIGELQALTWRDVNFIDNTININKTYTRKLTFEQREQGLKYIIKAPKSISSIRFLEMPIQFMQQLYLYRAKLPADYIYITEKERPISERALRSIIKSTAERAGLAVPRVHDLRHSHASNLILIGADLVYISKRLGHASIEETYKTYLHLLKENRTDLLSKLYKKNTD